MPTTSPKAPTAAKTETPPAFDLSTADWAKTGSDVLQVVQTAKQVFDAGKAKQNANSPQFGETIVQRPNAPSPKNPMAEVEQANSTAEHIRKENEHNDPKAPVGKMPKSLKIALALVSGCAAAFGTHLVMDKQPRPVAPPKTVVSASRPAQTPPPSAVPMSDPAKPRPKKATANASPAPLVAPAQPLPSQQPARPQSRRAVVLAGAGVGTALATFTALHFLA